MRIQPIRAGSAMLRVSPLLLLLCACIYAATGWWEILMLPVAAWYLWLAGNNWKLAYWLLLAAVPLSIEVRLLSTLSTSLPDEPMTWLFLLLLPILVLYKPGLLPARMLWSPIMLVVALQLAWVAVAVSCSQDMLLSLKYLMVRIWLVAAFCIFPFLIFRERRDFITGFRTLMLPLVLTVLVIMLRHGWMLFSFSQINSAIGKLYYNHVEYATIVSMALPLAVAAYPLTRGMKRWVRLAFLAVLLLLASAILLSYARAAVLAIAFCFLVAMGIRYRFVRWIMPVGYSLIIGAMVYLAHEHRYLDFQPDYEQTYTHRSLDSHLEATFNGTDMSTMERVYRWIAAIRMSRDKPLTGYGPNNFVRHYKSYTVSGFRTYVSSNDEQSTTHNYFLYLLAEQGWPGMLLYAILIMVVLSVAQATYHRFRDPFYKQCTLGLAMMFSAAIVNNFFSELTDTHKVGALFYLSMALISLLSYKSRQAAGTGQTPVPSG